jgi:hypothetical protein
MLYIQLLFSIERSTLFLNNVNHQSLNLETRTV